ncbi:MAG: protease complex subunit PrcB family protein [Weeksellaceae bacterium]|nr:protease complex subunit PrcB family protein [Weeksellaceae bacterium]
MRYFFLLMIGAFLFSCESQKLDGKGTAMDFKQIEYNLYGTNETANHVVVNDKSSFERQWRTLHQNMSPIPAVPQVDFGKNTVIIVNFGQMNHGGHHASVNHVYRVGDTVHVELNSKTPSAGEMVTTVMTNPYLILSTEKFVHNNVSLHSTTN